jgi:hypothetical protein
MADDLTLEQLTEIVRRIVAREIAFLDEKVAGLNDDDVDKLAKLSLVMQRIRLPAAKEADPNAGAEALTNEQLMKRSA